MSPGPDIQSSFISAAGDKFETYKVTVTPCQTASASIVLYTASRERKGRKGYIHVTTITHMSKKDKEIHIRLLSLTLCHSTAAAALQTRK